jgi:hypothetical protein
MRPNFGLATRMNGKSHSQMQRPCGVRWQSGSGDTAFARTRDSRVCGGHCPFESGVALPPSLKLWQDKPSSLPAALHMASDSAQAQRSFGGSSSPVRAAPYVAPSGAKIFFDRFSTNISLLRSWSTRLKVGLAIHLQFGWTSFSTGGRLEATNWGGPGRRAKSSEWKTSGS